MFNKIETEYSQVLRFQDFKKKYLIFAFIVALVLGGSYFIHENVYILLVSIILAIFLFIFLYYKLQMKKENINMHLFNMKKSFSAYRDKIYTLETKDLMEILKKHNFTTKDDLKIILDHYRNRIPRSNKSTILEVISNLAISVVSFIILFVDLDTGEINFKKMQYSLSFLVVLILILLFVYYLPKTVNFIFKTPKLDIYEDIESKLSYIYINYDKLKIGKEGKK